jgi:hypothetical protein
MTGLRHVRKGGYMKVVVAIFAVLVAAPLCAEEILVPPPQLDQVAKAHQCSPIISLVVDEESRQAASFDVHYEFHHGPPKALLAAWCTKDVSKPKWPYTLLIWAERQDQPLRTYPDEIPNVKRMGNPAIDAWPKIPHDFVMMDTGERLSVRETRVMFGVENHLPEGVDYYACVVGRWAHYSPEKK